MGASDNSRFDLFNPIPDNQAEPLPVEPATSSPAPKYTGKATQYAANYDAGFLDFCQTFLPDAFSFWVTDIDTFVIRKRTGKFMFLELKRNGYQVKEHQARTIKIVNALLSAGMGKTKGWVKIKEGGQVKKYKVQFEGYNILTLSGTSFEDSNFKWNGRWIEPEELIKKLAMED